MRNDLMKTHDRKTMERLAKWIVEESDSPISDIEQLLIMYNNFNAISFNKEFGYLIEELESDV